MATLPKYEGWIAELEQGRTPADLSHIAMSVSGRARFLAGEIPTFDWPAEDRAKVRELVARARAISDKTLHEDLAAYAERRYGRDE